MQTIAPSSSCTWDTGMLLSCIDSSTGSDQVTGEENGGYNHSHQPADDDYLRETQDSKDHKKEAVKIPLNQRLEESDQPCCFLFLEFAGFDLLLKVEK